MALAVIGYQQALSHGFIDSLVQSTDLVGDLRGFIGGVVLSSDSGVAGTVVCVFGLAALGDGGGGTYYWHNASTAVDDGFNAIKPTAISGAGRWLRLTPGGSAAATVTATGAVAIASVQRILLWQPTVPAAATFTLPATPMLGETHTIKNKLAAGTYPLTVAANAGQTIDGEPYLVLPNYNDGVTAAWCGAMWAAV